MRYIVQSASATYTSVSQVAYLPMSKTLLITQNKIAENETIEIEFYILV